MENLKLLRKVKKISSRREIQIARHLEANAIYFEHEFLNTTSESKKQLSNKPLRIFLTLAFLRLL